MRHTTPPRFPETPVCFRLVPAQEEAAAARPGPLEVPVLTGTFATMEGVLALVDAIGAAGAMPEFIDGVGDMLECFITSAKVTELGKMLPIARAATFGVTRRITRESHDSAVMIDSIARRFSDAATMLPDGLDVLVHGLDRWDRPSIRTLYRCCLLSGGALRVKATVAPRPATSSVERHREQWLRQLSTLSIVEDLRMPGVGAVGEDPADAGVLWDRLYRESFGTAMLELGNALAYQNYERAFLLLDAADRRPLQDSERIELQRVRAIADAQIGDIDVALRRLITVWQGPTEPLAGAHLAYLVGLLYTKRQFDLNEAERCYSAGLALLDGLKCTEDSIVERCWLQNGLALSRTLRARRTAGEERERLTSESFQLCFAALREVRPYTGEGALYLRYNLIANVAFLLEIAQRPAEAVRFWRGAFSGLLEAGSWGFAVAYWCRLGQLLAKDGDRQAADAFEQALVACQRTGDLFYQERVHASWAYGAFRMGGWDEAIDQHIAGAELAVRLRDRSAYLSHLAGWAYCLASAQQLGELAELARNVTEWPRELAADLARCANTAEACEALTRWEVRHLAPSPKLPPYIPSVDLEGGSESDLNRLLVTKPSEPLESATR